MAFDDGGGQIMVAKAKMPSQTRKSGYLYPRKHWGMRGLILAILLSLPIAFVGCGTPATTTTPAPPNSPQITVAQTVKTVADADQAAVKTVISLRDQGKLSQANTVTIENWLALVANTDKSIGLILAKPESWASQKVEIYALLATVTAPTIVTTIDPGAQAVITQVVTLLNVIKSQVAP